MLRLFRNKKQQEKSLSRWTLQERAAELVSPTMYLGLMVLEEIRPLQPVTAGNPEGLDWALLGKQFAVIKGNVVRKALFKGKGHILHVGQVPPMSGEKEVAGGYRYVWCEFKKLKAWCVKGKTCSKEELDSGRDF